MQKRTGSPSLRTFTDCMRQICGTEAIVGSLPMRRRRGDVGCKVPARVRQGHSDRPKTHYHSRMCRHLQRGTVSDQNRQITGRRCEAGVKWWRCRRERGGCDDAETSSGGQARPDRNTSSFARSLRRLAERGFMSECACLLTGARNTVGCNAQ